MLPPLPFTLPPDANALLATLAGALDDHDLRIVAEADRGEDREAHLAALRRLTREGVVTPLAWEPRDVLALTRWDRPPRDAAHEGRHWRRTFACAALLRVYGGPENHADLYGENQSLIGLIDSLRVLATFPLSRARRAIVDGLDAAGTAFLAWLIPRLPSGEQGEAAFHGLGLLWFGLGAKVADPALTALLDWIMVAEDAVAAPWRADFGAPILGPWLLPTTSYDQCHDLWRAFGGWLPERLRLRHGLAVGQGVRLIGAMLTPEPSAATEASEG